MKKTTPRARRIQRWVDETKDQLDTIERLRGPAERREALQDVLDYINLLVEDTL